MLVISGCVDSDLDGIYDRQVGQLHNWKPYYWCTKNQKYLYFVNTKESEETRYYWSIDSNLENTGIKDNADSVNAFFESKLLGNGSPSANWWVRKGKKGEDIMFYKDINLKIQDSKHQNAKNMFLVMSKFYHFSRYAHQSINLFSTSPLKRKIKLFLTEDFNATKFHRIYVILYYVKSFALSMVINLVF